MHNCTDVDKARLRSAETSKKHYEKDLDESCAESAETTKKHYEKDLTVVYDKLL